MSMHSRTPVKHRCAQRGLTIRSSRRDYCTRLAERLAQCLVQCSQIATGAAHMAHLAVAVGVRCGNVDSVQVRSPIRRTGRWIYPRPISLQVDNDLIDHRSGALG